MTLVVVFLADTAGAQVLPAVEVVPGWRGVPGEAEADTVPPLLGVRLSRLPGEEVDLAPIQPAERVGEKHSAKPAEGQVLPPHEEREEVVLLTGVDGGQLATTVLDCKTLNTD